MTDRVTELQGLRDRLIRATGECELRELAALSRQLVLVLGELDALEKPAQAKEGPLGELLHLVKPSGRTKSGR